MDNEKLAACCSTLYGHPAARWLIGASFHPGGLALTAQVARRLGLKPGMRVLDAGCGQGASASHVARSFGCRVVGVSLEEQEIAEARARAAQEGATGLADFVLADLNEPFCAPRSFDAALMECVLSILQDKDNAARRIFDVLRPGGCLGLTDVTVSGPLPDSLRGVLAVAGCVGDALPLEGYGDLLAGAGMEIEETADLPHIASAFLDDLSGRLLIAEIAVKLDKLALDPEIIQAGKAVLAQAQAAVKSGVLGYGIIIARRPYR